MIQLPEPLAFEWDSGNESKNREKHNVSIKEAEAVFNNNPTILFDDQRHSTKEKRFGMLGKTDKGRRLAITFTIRGNRVRVIMARDMIRKERSVYEETV